MSLFSKRSRISIIGGEHALDTGFDVRTPVVYLLICFIIMDEKEK